MKDKSDLATYRKYNLIAPFNTPHNIQKQIYISVH